MNLDQLETFLWVTRLGGVRKTAEQMNLSQAAVSSRIAALESSLKVSVFERSSTGVKLTRQGATLRDHAEQILFISERIREEIVPVGELDGLLRIGVAETVVQSWLPEFLHELKTRYPKITIEITVEGSYKLREQLIDRSLDLALLMGPVSEFSIDNVPLPDFELAWFKSAGTMTPLLSDVPVISFGRSTRPFRELRSALMQRYEGRTQMFPSNSLSACFEMVAYGIGVGALPLRLGEKWVEAGRIESFDPGWLPGPLNFTASFVGEPKDSLAMNAAHIAASVSAEY